MFCYILFKLSILGITPIQFRISTCLVGDFIHVIESGHKRMVKIKCVNSKTMYSVFTGHAVEHDVQSQVSQFVDQATQRKLQLTPILATNSDYIFFS